MYVSWYNKLTVGVSVLPPLDGTPHETSAKNSWIIVLKPKSCILNNNCRPPSNNNSEAFFTEVAVNIARMKSVKVVDWRERMVFVLPLFYCKHELDNNNTNNNNNNSCLKSSSKKFWAKRAQLLKLESLLWGRIVASRLM